MKNVVQSGGKVTAVTIGETAASSVLTGFAKGLLIGVAINTVVGSIKSAMNTYWIKKDELISTREIYYEACLDLIE